MSTLFYVTAYFERILYTLIIITTLIISAKLMYRTGFIFTALIALITSGMTIVLKLNTGIMQWKLLVVETICIVLTLLLTWLLLYMVRISKIIVVSAMETAESLQKIDDTTQLFTRNEFESKAKLIINSMSRKRERGFLLKLKLSEKIVTKQKENYVSLAKILLISTRSEYDLVGKITDDLFCILLQHTDEQGVKIIEDRIKSNFLAIDSTILSEIEISTTNATLDMLYKLN